MILVLGFLPLLSTFAGYYMESLLVEYGVLTLFALFTVSFYVLMINFQGRTLARREIEILEAVKEPTD
jgi:purine-cytosine permease-like protein